MVSETDLSRAAARLGLDRDTLHAALVSPTCATCGGWKGRLETDEELAARPGRPGRKVRRRVPCEACEGRGFRLYEGGQGRVG